MHVSLLVNVRDRVTINFTANTDMKVHSEHNTFLPVVTLANVVIQQLSLSLSLSLSALPPIRTSVTAKPNFSFNSG